MTDSGETALSAARRAKELAELPEQIDVLVVGLGATGAGVALDAASRGLSVLAVDAHDMAFGTSRWSSKMIHGGLRYLAGGHVAVARESAIERGILLSTTAPHLVRAKPFLLPLTPAVSTAKAFVSYSGMLFGDLLRVSARTPRSLLPGPRWISPTEVMRLAPGLSAGEVRGGVLHWDCQVVDDARLVIALARTAAGHGARIVTRCRALALGKTSTLRDELTGTEFEVRARAVINATGVWAGQLDRSIHLRPSRGSHLVLPSAVFGDLRAGLNIPIPGERARFALVLPQYDGRTYVGLTDEPIDGDFPDVPTPSTQEIDFLLDLVSAVTPRPIRREDLIGTFAGLRPLLAGGGHTSDLSRRHAVLVNPGGVVTVVGGKLTTYRRMASDAVDRALQVARIPAGPCVTKTLPLVGAAPLAHLGTLHAPARLVERYGTEAPLLAAGDLTPVVTGTDVTRAELEWAVSHEGALDVDDVLDRRTRIGLVATQRVAALPTAAEVLAHHRAPVPRGHSG
ncbi:MAG: glycerol-3-phosphate dehydrogenase/oxidase [Longispora sp.]|nr:glycerol-3-phosphate dehydrogenase/oxidase [Longispora sp. (in: high G+C Gram-positive bacteria)]